MTAGNQGKAYDDAQAALKLNPKDTALQAEAARTKAELNKSLTRAGQKAKD
jgi:hypothetical protein